MLVQAQRPPRKVSINFTANLKLIELRFKSYQIVVYNRGMNQIKLIPHLSIEELEVVHCQATEAIERTHYQIIRWLSQVNGGSGRTEWL